ncbi:MAG: hypothetical protein ACYCXY_13480, partial [Acidimicrobiales bacterium]
MRSSAHRHRLTHTIATPPRSTRRRGPLRPAPFADDDTGDDLGPTRDPPGAPRPVTPRPVTPERP